MAANIFITITMVTYMRKIQSTKLKKNDLGLDDFAAFCPLLPPSQGTNNMCVT